MKLTNSINIFIFLLVVACQNNMKEKDRISIDIHNNNITPVFSDLFSKIDIIPLETSDSCIIAQADKIMYRNDTIYILDKMQSSIFAFNGCGRIL